MIAIMNEEGRTQINLPSRIVPTPMEKFDKLFLEDGKIKSPQLQQLRALACGSEIRCYQMINCRVPNNLHDSDAPGQHWN